MNPQSRAYKRVSLVVTILLVLVILAGFAATWAGASIAIRGQFLSVTSFLAITNIALSHISRRSERKLAAQDDPAAQSTDKNAD